jgi:DNA mismatch repair ATPase MutL
MTRIRILSDDLANRIAAGETLELSILLFRGSEL